MVKLLRPQLEGVLSVETALALRRSVRDYSDRPLELAQLSQLLWAAQGITGARGFRTAPSAGALYPLELRVVVGSVAQLAPGSYRYDPHEHALEKIAGEDTRSQLAGAALGQPWVAAGAAVLVISGVFGRTTQRYGARGERYVYMEAGHAAQNVYIQAETLGLGTVVVGAFRGDEVKRTIPLPEEEEPLILMPVGQR